MEKSIALLRKAERIAKMYDPENGFFLAFSGGKDSQALYHIAQMAGVQFKAHFSPTSCDPPQLIRFIRRNYPDVEFAKLKMSIYDMAVKKHFPPTRFVRWCCAEYKENAGAGKVTLIGIRHQESTKRAARNEVEISSHKFSGDWDEFIKYRASKEYKNLNQDEFTHDKESEVRCINGKDSLLISPIIDWTDRDVWEFLNDVAKVPHCELYDPPYNQHRIGCILCPMAPRRQKLKHIKLWPYAKQKWIKAFEKIIEYYNEREANGGGNYSSDKSFGTVVSANLRWGGAGITAEDLFDWWISNLSYQEWKERKDTPSLPFEEGEGE
jgi:phosphoadenosine phosphosulfate reductase